MTLRTIESDAELAAIVLDDARLRVSRARDRHKRLARLVLEIRNNLTGIEFEVADAATEERLARDRLRLLEHRASSALRVAA